MQTDENSIVHLLSYSPQKRTKLQQVYERKSSVRITDTKPIATKRFSTGREGYSIPKIAKITPTTVDFPLIETCDNHLHTVKDASKANVYIRIDLNVKVIT